MLNKPSGQVSYCIYAIFMLVFELPFLSVAQIPRDTLPANVTLNDCIDYALINQPSLQQSILDEDITRQDIRIALSGWLPQLNSEFNVQHNLKLPVVFFPNSSNPTGPKQQLISGVVNTSALQLSANQTLYSTDLFFAGKTARDFRKLSSENTQTSKANLVVNVSKAFYDVLVTEQQLQVLDEDIVRLDKNYKDALSLYKSGLTEKTDWQRAMIALNNARAEKKSTEEAIKVKYVFLKQVIGAPAEKSFTILFDSTLVDKELLVDTMQIMNYEKRPEFQSLQTSMMLQHAKTSYYKWSFLPQITAFADYNFNYQNDLFSKLYNQNYPNSLVGLKLTMPIFQGGLRWQNIHKADLQYNRLNLDLYNLKGQISTEYAQALATYKSNLNELHFAKENIGIAKSIFKTVKLQYDEGVVMYLEVIVAETDLRTAQLNYLNVLYRVLSSTLDVKKALGIVMVK
jgi:outer membrane protein